MSPKNNYHNLSFSNAETNTMFDLKRKVALVTGGSRGIGLGITSALAKAGAKVIVNYREDEAAAEKNLQPLRSINPNIIAVQADIASQAERKYLVAKAVEHFGQIDILVNNAGIVKLEQAFLECDEENFQAVMDVNLKAPFFLTQLVAKAMIKGTHSGSVINIASVAGLSTCQYDIESYEISKAGLIMQSKSLSLALAKYNIRVNTISPGYVETDLNRSFWENEPDIWQERMKKVPLSRAGKPEEIANGVLYLASNSASGYATGTNIVIDGGLTSYYPI